MAEIDGKITERESEERELVFPSFTNSDALELGLQMANAAKSQGKAIAIDIERSGQKLFHYAMEGTSPDNDQWIRRKNKVVMRTFMSSYHVGLILQRDGMPIERRFVLDSMEYSAHGGSFPLRVAGVGVVGTITVSGLPQEEDHRLVVSSIRSFLENQKRR